MAVLAHIWKCKVQYKNWAAHIRENETCLEVYSVYLYMFVIMCMCVGTLGGLKIAHTRELAE